MPSHLGLQVSTSAQQPPIGVDCATGGVEEAAATQLRPVVSNRAGKCSDVCTNFVHSRFMGNPGNAYNNNKINAIPAYYRLGVPSPRPDVVEDWLGRFCTCVPRAHTRVLWEGGLLHVVHPPTRGH